MRCSSCNATFNSLSAFDLHRKGKYEDRFCLSEFGMEAIGMGQNKRGHWMNMKYSRVLRLSGTPKQRLSP